MVYCAAPIANDCINVEDQIMLKKIKLFSAMIGCILLAGCCADKSYNVVLLGDIHYDHLKYHDTSKMKHLGIPAEKHAYNKDGYFSWRSHSLWTLINLGGSVEKNTPLNMKMWENHVPAILDGAAAEAKKVDARCTIQLGDLIHGDCYDLELNKQNLRDAIAQLTGRFNKVLVVSGNHDSRGPGGQQAWDEVVNPYLDKTVRNLPRSKTNYYFMIDKDLYFFYDLMNPDLDLLEKALQENPDSRYTFFVSHVPLLPTGKRAIRSGLSDDIVRLFNLLEKRNAIVLSGHTHKISQVKYFNPANGRRIDQFIINSTVRYPDKQLKFKPQVEGNNSEFPGNAGKLKEVWYKLYDGKVTTLQHSHGTGFGILRASDDGVFVDYRNLNDSNVYTWRLR